MENISYNMYSSEITNKLSKNGIFLVTGIEKPNVMTMGWGSIGYFWGKPIFIAPVRLSRYSHDLIEKNNEFTVNIPFSTDMGKALAFCGTKSGRDVDKFKELNLTAIPSQLIKTPVIKECDIHYECKVVYKKDMSEDGLSSAINKKSYSDNNYHTLYFGEIVACYKTTK